MLLCDLKSPKLASDDCLPHAAMGLGSMRAVGTRPQSALVHRLVVQPQMTAWCLFRLDEGGGFIGETWHDTKEDALDQARKEFDVQPDDFREQT